MLDLLKRIFKFKKYELDESLINKLPDEILILIFLNLPAQFLCKKVILTCKKWRELIDSDAFWTQKLLHDLKTKPDLIKYLNDNRVYRPKKLYFKNPYTKNLIKNPCAELGFDYWILKPNFCFQENSNCDINKETHSLFDIPSPTDKNICINSFKINELDGFVIETENNGSEPIFDENNNNNKLKKYVTGQHMSSKYQIVDLISEGVDRAVLEKIKPKIEISDSYAGRRDFDSEYHIRVGLYDENFRKIYSIGFDHLISHLPQNGKWNQFKHVFEDYPDNLRYILFHHGGKDTQCLPGNLGVKITNSRVRFVLK